MLHSNGDPFLDLYPVRIGLQQHISSNLHDPYSNGGSHMGAMSPTNIMVDWLQSENACLLDLPLVYGMCCVDACV